jgi:hypothetical protein
MPTIPDTKQTLFLVVEGPPDTTPRKIVPLHNSGCCWLSGERGAYIQCDAPVAHWTEANPIRPPYSYCHTHRLSAYVPSPQSRRVAA